ncbi:MAG: hypothetical protein ABEJ42_05720 [Halobacteriaceae archaeon]
MRPVPAAVGALTLAVADLAVGAALYLSVSRVGGALLVTAGLLVVCGVVVESARAVGGAGGFP